ncbi:hypothetical protein GGR50DRAFT_221539 [Xylaria sp. CBS 124048]|nr:hypothetical protein GGR50DRAFT_221539 [Xylaria sp. CBS 124048]
MYRYCTAIPEYRRGSRERPRPQRSFSANEHHRPNPARPRHSGTVDWSDLVESERNLRYVNGFLAHDNEMLKTDLYAIHEENRRLRREVKSLRQNPIDPAHWRPAGAGATPAAEVPTAQSHHRETALQAELDAKNLALRDQKKKRHLADIRVRELTQTVTLQNVEIDRLKYEKSQLLQSRRKNRDEIAILREQLREARQYCD